MDRYEVTNVQYQRFLQATGREPPPYWPGSDYPPGQADYPVVGATWEDADAYCAWVGRCLPTEAEWENACRGTDGRVYPWGDTWDPGQANVDRLDGDLSRPSGYTEPGLVGWGDDWAPLRATPTGPGAPGLQPVGSYPDGASPYGVMDLVGGVSEWVADWYNEDTKYEVQPVTQQALLEREYKFVEEEQRFFTNREYHRSTRRINAQFDLDFSSLGVSQVSWCLFRNSADQRGRKWGRAAGDGGDSISSRLCVRPMNSGAVAVFRGC